MAIGVATDIKVPKRAIVLADTETTAELTRAPAVDCVFEAINDDWGFDFQRLDRHIDRIVMRTQTVLYQARAAATSQGFKCSEIRRMLAGENNGMNSVVSCLDIVLYQFSNSMEYQIWN